MWLGTCTGGVGADMVPFPAAALGGQGGKKCDMCRLLEQRGQGQGGRGATWDATTATCVGGVGAGVVGVGDSSGVCEGRVAVTPLGMTQHRRLVGRTNTDVVGTGNLSYTDKCRGAAAPYGMERC